MYNDTIKVANKIITDKNLFEIFALMNEKLVSFKKTYQMEEAQNRMLEYNYQKWTFKDNGSSLSFDVNFYDDTNIKFDNYNNFLAIFNSRLHEIKSIWVNFRLSYMKTSPESSNDWYNQHINMSIYENKADIDVSLSSADNRIDDVYNLIKNIVLNAPPKYDTVIKKKSKINTVVGLAIGFIPSLVISTILLFVPAIRQIFAASYVLYPVCCLILAFFIGGTMGSAKLDRLYKSISPEQKYAGYDSTNYKSIYKDDIDSYVQSSEILIGKNIDNLKCREDIMNYYTKYKTYIPYEIGVMVLLSIITLFLGGI